ncbi:hypothetical protein PINS_up000434 [Pythium insidiosum]|nr:hypothetical protein PINS_up000434 [Pythium insidiosum]
MSADYLLKMEALRQRREELTARRGAIERRIALREATAAEYSAVALQSYKQKWKSLRAAAISAKKRNDEFIRSIHETQRQVNETYHLCKQGMLPGDQQLAQEKARYMARVEELYPAWQEKLQRIRVQKLKELEDKKRAIERRRMLAKKTFETEQTLEDLIRRTSHEIELAENLEKNEAYERGVLRNQSIAQSAQLDQLIRDHALGARMYMSHQASEHFREAEFVNTEVQGRWLSLSFFSKVTPLDSF